VIPSLHNSQYHSVCAVRIPHVDRVKTFLLHSTAYYMNTLTDIIHVQVHTMRSLHHKLLHIKTLTWEIFNCFTHPLKGVYIMSQRAYTCLHPHTFMSLPSFRYCTWLTRIAHAMATIRGCLLPSSSRAILSGQLNHFRVASALLSLKRGKIYQFMVLQFLKSFP